MKKTSKGKVNPEDKVNYLTTAAIPGLVTRMAVPTMISMLVTTFYNLIDTLFVGKLDNQSTGAVGITFSVMAIMQAFGFLFGHGSGNYISRKLGAGETDNARKMAATGFFSSLAVGILIAVFGFAFVDPLAKFLGSTDTMLPFTRSYMSIIFLGAPFIMGSFVLNNQMRFQGCAGSSMIGIVTGAVLNTILDPVLIFVFDLKVAGAAYATVISQMVSFIILLIMNKKMCGINVRLKDFSFEFSYYKDMFKGGVPSLCRQSIASLATICLNIAAGRYAGNMADAAIAAMSVVGRVAMFANSALIGFGQGFQPVCGTNYGAGKYDRVREAYRFCVKTATVALVIMSVAGIIFAEPLIRLFRNDPDVIKIGTVTLIAQFAAFVLNANTVLCNMLMQTIGMAFKASVIAMARQGLFFIPLIFILPRIFGLPGVEYCQAVADVCAFIVSVPFSISVLKNLGKTAGNPS